MMRLLPVLLLAGAALAGCLNEVTDDGRPHTPDDGLGNSVQRPPSTEPDRIPPSWPDLGRATVRPGVQVTSDAGQCTSNFVFTSPDNTTLYLGLAAHCFGEGEATDTNGCEVDSLPLGSAVEVAGAGRGGVLVYSSWLTMQDVGESGGNACAANDFALVQLHADDRDAVHPAVFHFGGPTGLAPPGEVAPGDRVLTFGNTSLRPGPQELDEREGFVVTTQNGGWTHTVYTIGPGLPGDSGSGVLTADGRALGVLVTLAVLPLPASNGVTNLQRALDYAHENAGLTVQLATWEQLDSGLLPSGAPPAGVPKLV